MTCTRVASSLPPQLGVPTELEDDFEMEGVAEAAVAGTNGRGGYGAIGAPPQSLCGLQLG